MISKIVEVLFLPPVFFFFFNFLSGWILIVGFVMQFHGLQKEYA